MNENYDFDSEQIAVKLMEALIEANITIQTEYLQVIDWKQNADKLIEEKALMHPNMKTFEEIKSKLVSKFNLGEPDHNYTGYIDVWAKRSGMVIQLDKLNSVLVTAWPEHPDFDDMFLQAIMDFCDTEELFFDIEYFF